MKGSSLCKLSSYIYSVALELEYSHVHVIIIEYELEYSPYDMCLACSSMFFIVHMLYMTSNSNTKGITVRCAFGLTYVLARPSVGWESWGDVGRTLVCGRGVRIRGILRI